MSIRVAATACRTFVVVGTALAGAVLVARITEAKTTSGVVEPCPKASAWLAGFYKRRSAQEHRYIGVRPSDPSMAKELARRAAQDGAAEKAWINSRSRTGSSGGTSPSNALAKGLAIQKANLDWLRPKVDEHGFPTVQEVGLDGVKNAWLLAQHADSDPAFQEKVLSELKPRLQAEPYLREQYALLTDRVRLNYLHEKQLYGTQFTFRHGHLFLRPVEHPSDLAARRRSMDLMPMDYYRCVMRVNYHLSK